jgi:chromate reductase, NAD(P)H dehydrogenase (quinone)
MAEFKILGISGSLRKGSFNTAALRTAQEMAPPGATVEIADLRDVPMYDDDLRAAGYPAPVEKLRREIGAADAILFATPEYNYSISGVLKNAIDWASRPPDQPLNEKPVAILGAAGGVLGTARAQYHLRQILIGLNAFTLNNPQVFIASAAQKFDAQGALTDPVARDLIRQLLDGLVTWAKRVKK